MSLSSAFVPCSFNVHLSQPHTAVLNGARLAMPFRRRSVNKVARPIVIRATASPTHKSVSRRSALQLLSLGAAGCLLPTQGVLADTEYATYKGPISLGFTFSYPSAWAVKKKPIKTHLSEVIVTSDKEASTTAGLVVDSVKIESIDKFGTPEIVGKKVVAVETKKDNVTSASVIAADSVTDGGLTYYIIDYVVDSSRGEKRYLAKATITGGQLYVFTAQAKRDSFKGETRAMLQRMLDSFIVAKQYL